MLTLDQLTGSGCLKKVLASRVPVEFRRGSIFLKGWDNLNTYEFFTQLSLAERMRAVRDLLEGRTEWSPILATDIPKPLKWADARAIAEGAKPSTVARRIGWGCKMDHGAELVLMKHLQPLIRRGASPVAVAYVPGLALDEVIVRTIATARTVPYQFALVADVRSCFDTLSWDLLDRAVDTILGPITSDDVRALLKRSYRVPVVHQHRGLEVRTKGVPQGTVLAPMLCNLFFRDVDARLNKRLSGGLVRRFADDVLVLCETQEESRRARSILEEEMLRVHLDLKTVSIRDLRNRQNAPNWLGIAFNLERTWVPRERIEAKAASLLVGLHRGKMDLEGLERRLMALRTTYGFILSDSEVERTIESIRTLLKPYLHRYPPQLAGGIDQVRTQLGLGRRDHVRAPSQSEQGRTTLEEPSKGRDVVGVEAKPSSSDHATPTGGTPATTPTVVARDHDDSTTPRSDSGALVGTTVGPLEASHLGKPGLDAPAIQARVRPQQAAIAVQHGASAAKIFIVRRRDSVVRHQMKIPKHWTPQEVALRGYAEGIHVLNPHPGDKVTLRITNETLVGYIHRNERIRNPWIAKAWIDLFELVSGLEGVRVDLLTRDGERSHWKAA